MGDLPDITSQPHDPVARLAALPAEPVGVWDARSSGWEFSFGTLREQQGEWLKRNLGNPRVIHRVEFYAAEKPFAVVHRYALDKDGFKHQDPATGEAAVEPPVTVPLTKLPPAHLLTA